MVDKEYERSSIVLTVPERTLTMLLSFKVLVVPTVNDFSATMCVISCVGNFFSDEEQLDAV